MGVPATARSTPSVISLADFQLLSIASFDVTSSFQRLKIINSSEVLLLPDIRASKNFTFYNVKARQSSSFCYMNVEFPSLWRDHKKLYKLG